MEEYENNRFFVSNDQTFKVYYSPYLSRSINSDSSTGKQSLWLDHKYWIKKLKNKILS